jgi:uncharacterized coiled-coil DUF342 family protein
MDKKIIKKILNLPYNTKIQMNSNVSNILKKVSVKLNVVSDAENFYSQLDESMNEFSRIKEKREEVENTLIDLIQEYDFLIEDIDSVAPKLADTLTQLEEKAEELGASAGEFFPYYNDSVNLLDNYDKIYKNYFKYN